MDSNKGTPWWMVRIMDFDGLEIKPCEVIGHTLRGDVIAQPCEPEQADFWSVYGHYKPGGVLNGIEDFEDFKTEAEAIQFRDRLLKAYPHLRGERSSPEHENIAATVLQASVKPPEATRKHKRHDQHTCSKNEHVPGVTQTEISNATDKQISDNQIEEAPQDIDDGGG